MSPFTVVFDLDGTLVDTAPDLAAATNHVLKSAGRRAVSLAEVRTMCGRGARMLIRQGFEDTGRALPEAELAPLYRDFIAHYSAHIADQSLTYPGAIDLLERCRDQGIAMAVCTNKLEDLTLKLIETLKLTDYFSAILGPDTIGIAKPDAAPYLAAVERSAGVAARSVMIGDSKTDVATARAAGVPVIGVTFGYTDRHISSFGPDHVVDHFNEIWPLIDATMAAAHNA